ncbi:hypothetical protein [Desulfosporosinus meridiei]|uniref:Uncharacterized protein n=1 Tax=Desulfosporosinus meridiei (strain ATCC BAA-275 / DSM 13257 / KCTC 12902 / NCIMB 13706 / S10) TaxID=768704 RepID=J7IZN6_DESMD|nr:hypothetical protein [Desulfosporosinus meridiei]AFQ44181.1 hypothetical protein Desmer_2245 [Desulfosporosinus meridiei DSM 13257]
MSEQDQMLTQRETIELHELLSIEVMAKKKLKTTKTTIQDYSELSSYVDDVINAKEQNVEELKQFISSNVLQ